MRCKNNMLDVQMLQKSRDEVWFCQYIDNQPMGFSTPTKEALHSPLQRHIAGSTYAEFVR